MRSSHRWLSLLAVGGLAGLACAAPVVGPARDCAARDPVTGFPVPAGPTGWQLSALEVTPQVLTPANANAINDATAIRVELNPIESGKAPADAVRIDVRAVESCEIVRSLPATLSPDGRNAEVTWDGRDERAVPVPPGDFSLTATAYFANGVERQTPAIPVLVTDDPCADPSDADRSLLSIENGSVHERVRVTLPKASHVCVRMAAPVFEDDGLERPPTMLLIDGAPVAESAASGGVELTSVSLPAGTHVFGLVSGLPGASAGGWLPPIDILPGGDTPFDAQTCEGRLMGFTHPFGVHGQEPVPRGNVVVDCLFEVRIQYRCLVGPCKPRSIRKVVRARGRTEADGTFAVTIPEQRFIDNGVFVENARPLTMQTVCHPLECGYEARGFSYDVSTFADLDDGQRDRLPGMDVTDVLDIVVFDGNDAVQQQLGSIASARFSGLGVPSEPKESARARVGARLVSNGTTDAERNDLPIVIHEQIDVLNIEATNFAVWALSGQALRGELSGPGCPENPIALCVPFRDNCRPSLCESHPEVSCTASPVLQRALADGFDVWLVDHLQGDIDIVEIASASPALYERIARYPAAPSVGIGLLGPPPPARRIAVGGISLGSVVARVALKLWEERGALPEMTGVRPADLAVPTGTPEERVALYFSVDAPHRGARIPLALQAYLQSLPPISSQISRLKTRLNALPSRQFVREWIPPVQTPCFPTVFDGSFDASEDLKSCTVDHANAIDVANSTAFNDLQRRTVAVLDAEERDPLGRSPDGLPDLVRSIAISNGRLTPLATPAGHPEVFHLKLDPEAPFGAGDEHQRIRDTGLTSEFGTPLPEFDQPRGSGFDGVCRAAIDGPSRPRDVVEGVIGGVSSVFGWTIPIYGWVEAGLAAGTPAKTEISIPMSPDSPQGGKIFPTLVPTDSSLLVPAGDLIPVETWHDYYAPPDRRRHTAFEDDQCKFLMYHLNGAMKGDLDGVPPCEREQLLASCSEGGLLPGRRLDPDRTAAREPEKHCDCNDVLGHVSPNAAGRNACALRPRLNAIERP